MKPCPCGSGKLFMKCCKPFITGKALPTTAEQLMRSRYSAYTRADMDYIQATMRDNAAENFDVDSAKAWAEKAKWLSLKVTNTSDGSQEDQKGTVSFLAQYKSNGELHHLHENSLFEKHNGRWFYVGSV